jgi:epoxyqueuosine reductase
MNTERVISLARDLGFALVGVTPAQPTLESLFYPKWLEQGYAGEMGYLLGRRGDMRRDPRSLLPSAKSLICLGFVYNTSDPYSTEVEFDDRDRGWVSRYAWGEDYHHVLRGKLQELVERLQSEAGAFDYKVAVDTAPLLERAYAHHAGLGWIGKNTCLINQQLGSWVFLCEVLTSLDLEPDEPAPFRCGTCTRCIDACPTDALVPTGESEGPEYALDSTKCISYWTIELRGPIPDEHRAATGSHLFGCDICQDVCPWNGRAATTELPEFKPKEMLPELADLASLSEEEFNERFADSPIERSRYRGFLRNVAVVMGNSGNRKFLPALTRLAENSDPLIREHARWALQQLDPSPRAPAEP